MADCLREAIISNIWLMVGGGAMIPGGSGETNVQGGGYAQTSTVVARPNPTHPCLFTPALYPGPYGQPSVEPRPQPFNHPTPVDIEQMLRSFNPV